MLDPLGVLLPAAFAGTVAIGATAAIERWGGRAGGLLATLPSTIVPASLGFYAGSPTTHSYQLAVLAIPAGMLVNALFLWCWRLLPHRLPGGTVGQRLAWMVAASLAVWAAAAAACVLLLRTLSSNPQTMFALAGGLTTALVVVGGLACLRAPPSPKGSRRVSALMLLARGLLAAAAIGGAVALAAVGGPMAAGMAASFPAIFITTMVSLWLSQGQAVQIGAVGPMMLGSGSVSLYAVIGAWSLPALGPIAGTMVAWLGAAGLVTVPAWLWLARRPKDA